MEFQKVVPPDHCDGYHSRILIRTTFELEKSRTNLLTVVQIGEIMHRREGVLKDVKNVAFETMSSMSGVCVSSPVPFLAVPQHHHTISPPLLWYAHTVASPPFQLRGATR